MRIGTARTALVGIALTSLVTTCAACTSSTTGSGPSSASSHAARRASTAAGSTSATSTPASSAPSGSASATARTVSVLGSGDVLVHPQLVAQAHADAGGHGYSFTKIYASVMPDTRAADLATCELETPLAPPDGPFAGYPNFSAPPQVLTALKNAGYDSCTTASNHSLDYGYAGVRRTLDELDAAGLRHTGSARSAREANTPMIITTSNGVRVGQLAYSFGFNGIPLPAGRPWLANQIDVPTILAAAKRMKAAGADVVVLSMHWGTEYDHLATAEQQSMARRLLASPDIDLILGDHAHVVQPARRIDGKWVFFCMGDQISRHADPIPGNREGAMPLVTFTETSPHHFRTTSAQAIPTWMAFDPLRLIDLPRALAGTGLSAARRAEYAGARKRIAGYLDAYGAGKGGLVVR